MRISRLTPTIKSLTIGILFFENNCYDGLIGPWGFDSSSANYLLYMWFCMHNAQKVISLLCKFKSWQCESIMFKGKSIMFKSVSYLWIWLYHMRFRAIAHRPSKRYEWVSCLGNKCQSFITTGQVQHLWSATQRPFIWCLWCVSIIFQVQVCYGRPKKCTIAKYPRRACYWLNHKSVRRKSLDFAYALMQ